MKNILYLLSIILIFYSCDIIDPPYEENANIDTDSTTKKVLLEDFTGFRCGNCPEAGELAHEIVKDSKEQVIIMTIHAGSLADPTPQRPYNFKTPVGNDIANYYKLPGTPFGLINRESYNGSHLQSPSSWRTLSFLEMQKKSYIKIEPAAEYNDATREISLNAKIKFLKEYQNNMYLVAYIVEDSIIQYQKDDRKYPNTNIENFVHMHVLRGSMNGTWGEQISNNTIVANSIIDKQFKYIIPQDKDWKPKHLALIVAVHNNDTRVIEQVEKVYIYK